MTSCWSALSLKKKSLFSPFVEEAITDLCQNEILLCLVQLRAHLGIMSYLTFTADVLPVLLSVMYKKTVLLTAFLNSV